MSDQDDLDLRSLDDGELVEQGDLESLLANNGLFAWLYKLQRFERNHARQAEFI